jgi:hypothetical protein
VEINSCDAWQHAQDESLSRNSTSANAVTAQVFNAQGHIDMTAMTVNSVREHVLETTMLAQTGVNGHDSQHFAQKQPDTSEISTQTEQQIEDCSTNVQQSMHVRSRFEEGQEHTGVQCDMDGTLKGDNEATEMELYAHHLWLELQQEPDQNGFVDGQEQANKKNAEAEMSSVQEIESTDMEQARNRNLF